MLNNWRCEQGSNLRGNIPLDYSRTIAWLLLLEKPDRLILETDSPYLADDPMSIYDIAEGVAHYFGITTSELIRVCNKNAAKLYNLAW